MFTKLHVKVHKNGGNIKLGTINREQTKAVNSATWIFFFATDCGIKQ